MEAPIVKEIILNNIIIKEKLLRKVNTALFVFRRDFNQLKVRENFSSSLAELLDILHLQLKSKEKLEKALSELDDKGTISGISVEDINLPILVEVAGDILQVEDCGEQESFLSTRVDELLTAL